jgi:hypothetical protein
MFPIGPLLVSTLLIENYKKSTHIGLRKRGFIGSEGRNTYFRPIDLGAQTVFSVLSLFVPPFLGPYSSVLRGLCVIL